MLLFRYEQQANIERIHLHQTGTKRNAKVNPTPEAKEHNYHKHAKVQNFSVELIHQRELHFINIENHLTTTEERKKQIIYKATVVLSTWEAEIGRITVSSQSSKTFVKPPINQ
jgi:hypothetical protein